MESEDWSQQPELSADELNVVADYEEPAVVETESELLKEEQDDDSYLSIEELMREDGAEQEDPDAIPMNLNVGLDEFPDLMSDVNAVDVDSGGEIAHQLDLAKAYIEMNDIDGAIKLLENVAQHGTTEMKQEAGALLDQLK